MPQEQPSPADTDASPTTPTATLAPSLCFPLLGLPPTCSSSLPPSVDGRFVHDLETLLAIHSVEGQEIVGGRYAQHPPPRSGLHDTHDLPIRVRLGARVDGPVVPVETEPVEGRAGDDPLGALRRAEALTR